MDEISDFEIVERTNLKKRDKMFFYTCDTCAMNCMEGHEERAKIEGEKGSCQLSLARTPRCPHTKLQQA